MKKLRTITAATALTLAAFSLTARAQNEDVESRYYQRSVQQQAYEQRPDGDQGYGQREDYRQEYDPRGRGEDDRGTYRPRGGGGLERLQRDVDHLNRMMDHVGRKMNGYGASRRTIRQYEHLRAEAARLNIQFQRGEQYVNRSRLHAEIDHMRAELHQIEQDLRFRQGDFFQWR